MRVQFAALCHRQHKGETQVLLLTSRDTGRWIIPKGWPMPGRSPVATAAAEAWEEGGVKGSAVDSCLGLYTYTKSLDTGVDLPVAVAVFPVAVTKLARRYPEAGLRRRRWTGLRKAAARVEEPELKEIIKCFDPTKLR